MDLQEAVGKDIVNNRNTSESTEDDEDDNLVRYGAIIQHIKGREIAITKDKELSFVLEYLLKLTGIEGIYHRYLIPTLYNHLKYIVYDDDIFSIGIQSLIIAFLEESEKVPDLIPNLVCHSCASHVIECVFECLAKTSGKVDKKLLKSLINRIFLQPEILMENTYASHVIEKMLMRLCRVLKFDLKGNQLSVTVFDSKTSSERIFAINKDDPSKTSGLLNDALSKAEIRNFHSAISAVENVLLDESSGGLKTESVISICRTSSGSVILQVIMKITMSSRMYIIYCCLFITRVYLC